jgi:surfeit locus 1 family protein
MGVRYGFLLRPRWIAFHLLVIAAIVAMINLGFWQLRRLDERRDFNEQVSSRIDLPPEPLDEVVGATTDPDAVEWRSVEASGTYLPAEQFVVVNRSQGGRPGDLVATPLELDDGRILLIERGFVPLDTDSAPAPSGEVEIVGRLRPSQERRRGQLSDPAEGELDQVQRMDIDRLAGQLPGPVVPMYVELVSSTPAETGPFPEPIAAPELDEGPHLSYAVQWFIFAVCVAVGWVLALRHSIRSRTTTRTAPPDPVSLEH